MGAAQATDVLEPLRVARPRIARPVIPKLPRLRLSGLLGRELSIAEASFVLMASFFVSALLGAVRQVLFNADFGAGSTARAYYAAFRLPDTLFSLIAGILATRADPALGIYGPTLGVVAGAVLQLLILPPGLRARQFRYRPSWNRRDARLREVVRLLIPNGLAVGVGYCGFIVDTAFASTAKEHAGLPAIHNAWLLVTLPIALLGQAIGQAAFPRLAAYADARDWHELGRTLKRSLSWVIALAIPAAIALLVLSRPTIRILFEHGKFTASAGALTSKVLVAYAIALPAAVTSEVLARGLIALRDTRTPLFANSAQLLGRALIMALLIGAAGVVAIPIAFAAMAFVEALALATVLLLRLRARAPSVHIA
jgi:putative peptidoglycan lipid II flippase